MASRHFQLLRSEHYRDWVNLRNHLAVQRVDSLLPEFPPGSSGRTLQGLDDSGAVRQGRFPALA
jgi:hypothetical protein